MSYSIKYVRKDKDRLNFVNDVNDIDQNNLSLLPLLTLIPKNSPSKVQSRM